MMMRKSRRNRLRKEPVFGRGHVLEKKTERFRIRHSFVLMLLALVIGCHTILWWVFRWQHPPEKKTAAVPILFKSSLQSECAVWKEGGSSVGIVFNEHLRPSLHKGHFHFFHLMEFVVVSWIELLSRDDNATVEWVNVPHMRQDQAYGPDLNRLLLQLVFGRSVQLTSYDSPPPPHAKNVTLLSIERSKCTDASVKKMWWKHIDRFPAPLWHLNLQARQLLPQPAEKHKKKIRIAYIDRQNTRRRFPIFFHWWLIRYLGEQVPQQFPNTPVEFVHIHMEQLSAEEQVRAASQMDILVSMHGNGLTHQFFMPPRGAVVEIFWEFPFAFDYATAAAMMQHEYMGLWNGQLLDKDRLKRLDPTLRTELSAGRVYAWYETEWTSPQLRERLDASKRAMQEFITTQVQRIEQERGSLLEPTTNNGRAPS